MAKARDSIGKVAGIEPFEGCPCLDGYHCQTNSLAKIFHHARHPLSEDVLLGLGAGMGFIYWQMRMGKESYVFVGGRANNKNFFGDLGERTGVKIRVETTSSSARAEAWLLERLKKKEPVMVFGDMGFLPWFEFPVEYHFGGHTFVVCGFDGKGTLLASDMDQAAAGLKKGFYAPISLEQLRRARGSTFKPFPPKNAWLEFDFSGFRKPTPEDFLSAIRQAVDSQLHPPIKNIGVKGLRHTAREILRWPKVFGDRELRMNLFNFYIFIEIGGTGGGCFRQMYSRFLGEAAGATGISAISDASRMFHESGKRLTDIGLMFKDAEAMTGVDEKIKAASRLFDEIAGIEEDAYTLLEGSV